MTSRSLRLNIHNHSRERTFLNDDKQLDSVIYNIYPIAWITKSKALMDFVASALVKEQTTEQDKEFLVADFAAGEYDRVPSFIVTVLPELLSNDDVAKKRIAVYCTDLHALRLDSLLGFTRP